MGWLVLFALSPYPHDSSGVNKGRKGGGGRIIFYILWAGRVNL